MPAFHAQQVQLEMMNKMREQNESENGKLPVSFNGTSVMIDSLLNSYRNNSGDVKQKLLDAVLAGDSDRVRRIVGKDAAMINAALFLASEKNVPGILNELLGKVGDVDSVKVDETGFTLLHVAAEHGAKFCAEILLARWG